MYLNPRSVFEKFLVEEKRTRIDPSDRQAVEFVATGDEILGVVSSLSQNEVKKWRKLSNEVDCIIIQRLGAIKAKVGGRLIKAERKYYVEAIENPAGVSQFYLYFCNERKNLP